MSRVIFLGYPAHGHTNPTLGLVRELMDRGEEVIYYSDEANRIKIEKTGAVFRSYRGQLMSDQNGASRVISDGIEGLIFLTSGVLKAGMNIMSDILEVIREEKPAYIIHDSHAHWGKLIARKLGIPAISSLTAFAYNDNVIDRHPEIFMENIFRISKEVMAKKYRAGTPREALNMLSEYFKKLFGLESFDIGDMLTGREELNIVYSCAPIQFHREEFDDSFKFVGPSIHPRKEETDFPFDRLEGKPVYYISMGTIFNSLADFYKKCFEAFGGTDRMVVLAVGEKINIRELGPAPENFIVRNYIPQLEILKRTDVFIMHAGFNSVSEAIYYHVPMVMLPQNIDQFMMASQVEKIGAGIYIRNPDFRPAELRELAEKVYSDKAFRQNTMPVAEAFKAAGGIKRAADEIFAFKARKGIH